MAGVNPRSTPIALVIAGAIIISAAISGKAFGNLSDTILGLAILVGFLIIVFGGLLYYWERNKYYKELRFRP